MVEPEHVGEALFPERVGDRLRAARVKAGLDLTDIAAKTRVPLRHLSAIEGGDYSSFPSSTYCVGFVKAYARAVGQDEAALARDLRSELGEVRHDPREFYEVDDADPARLPTARLAWTAALILIVLAGAYWAFRQWQIADPRDDAPAVVADAPVTRPTPSAPPPATDGQVVLTATAPVWVRIYDAADAVLLQKEMSAGETFAVPPGANTPQIRTGRPELLQVTVGGRPVPPLGTPERMIKNVGISAAALAARTVTIPPAQQAPGNSAPQAPRPAATRQEAPVARTDRPALPPPAVNTSAEAGPPPTTTP